MKRLLRVLLPAILALPASQAVHEKEDGWPWNIKLHGHHDAEVAEATGGWFLNVGPTGIRAQITKEHPKYFTVKYVFKQCPAAGLVEAGDIIVGANGKRMNVEHTFGRHVGWEGPMMEMAKLIEDSQGADGKLELIVWPKGDRQKEKEVAVQIEPVGRFSDTYPFNCPRSDQLYLDLCDWLLEEHERAGTWEKPRPHTYSACMLALMASPERRHQKLVEDNISRYYDKRYDPNNGTGFPAWGQVHDAVVMGEYYLLHEDKRLKDAMESVAFCLENSVWPTTGGLSHRPFAFIQRRMHGGGPKGYGAMAMPAGIGMIGLSLFKEAGLPHGGPSYARIHEGFLCTVGDNGQIGYGFTSWDHAVIDVGSENAAPKPPKEGIGYECPDGLKGVGDYKIVWPTKADPRYRPTDWLTREVDTNRVFHKGDSLRLVVRNMSPEEPTRPYKYGGGRCGGIGKSGAGALAHLIGNEDKQSWQYLGGHMATGCARNPEQLLNGHASTHMHVLWGSLGAARADEKDFRKYMDYIKWWMIMAQTHDGSYVVMPGRDYASTDHVYGTRNFPTACAALILATKDRRLRITGRPADGSVAPATNTTRRSSLPSKLRQRPARQIAAEARDELNEILYVSLLELSNEQKLVRLPMDLSKARSKVWLSKVELGPKFEFSAMQGSHKAVFGWEDMDADDQAMLAAVVARLRAEDPVSQAVAGIYMEAAGDVEMADNYYKKAGPEFADKINSILK